MPAGLFPKRVWYGSSPGGSLTRPPSNSGLLLTLCMGRISMVLHPHQALPEDGSFRSSSRRWNPSIPQRWMPFVGFHAEGLRALWALPQAGLFRLTSWGWDSPTPQWQTPHVGPRCHWSLSFPSTFPLRAELGHLLRRGHFRITLLQDLSKSLLLRHTQFRHLMRC